MIASCRLMALTFEYLSMAPHSTAISSRNRVFDMKWGCAFLLVIAFGSVGHTSAVCGMILRYFVTPSRATSVKMKEWRLMMVTLERLHALSSVQRALAMTLTVNECNRTSGTDRKQSTSDSRIGSS